VLGSPIEHSLSPALHRAAYVHLGLNWSYNRIEVNEQGLSSCVDSLDTSWRGLSLTMPLKVAVLELGEVDPLAQLAVAGNTLILEGGRRQIYNTDIGGLTWAVRQVTAARLPRVIILGAGATARAALLAANELGAKQINVVARTPARAESLRTLSQRLGVELDIRPWSGTLPEADLAISTVVSGAADSIADAVSESAPVIVDAIYDPWPTVLATAALHAGCTVVSGRDLLIGQALLQIELMTGHSVPAEVLYAALESEPREQQPVPDF
jgi:shikimate dehydrogenase